MSQYDHDSGQVFKEYTIPRNVLGPRALGQSDLDWSRQRPYQQLHTPRGARGPRSLIDQAISIVADHIHYVTEEHALAMPPALMWRIWHYLEVRGIYLAAWKLYSKLVWTSDDPTLAFYRFRHHICHPSEQLRRYTEPLTSPTFEFITHLVISGNCNFTTMEMLSLTQIKNLGVLEIIEPTDSLGEMARVDVTDRLIRGWTEADDPFPLLRVLRIWGHETTTQDSLAWVSKFPSLMLYDVIGARADWKKSKQYAVDYDWELADVTSSTDESLLRDLTLLIPNEESRPQNIRSLARSIESDLISICSDSQCAVKHTPHGEAPRLVDYLTDTAKVHAPTWSSDVSSMSNLGCRGTVFEPWAFWLYSFIGQLTQDMDLKNAGVKMDTQSVAGPFVLPSRPFASLYLGHSGHGGISRRPAYLVRGLFSTERYTFTRAGAGASAEQVEVNLMPEVKAQKETRTGTPSRAFRPQKRMRMEDILQSFDA